MKTSARVFKPLLRRAWAMDAVLDERPAPGEPPDPATSEESEAEVGTAGEPLPNSGYG